MGGDPETRDEHHAWAERRWTALQEQVAKAHLGAERKRAFHKLVVQDLAYWRRRCLALEKQK